MSTLEYLRSKTGYIGVRETADLIDYNRYTVLDWARDGKIPTTRIGNSIKIDRMQLADWLEARQISGGTIAQRKPGSSRPFPVKA